MALYVYIYSTFINGIMGARNDPYSDIIVAWYKSLVTTDLVIFSARERNIFF